MTNPASIVFRAELTAVDEPPAVCAAAFFILSQSGERSERSGDRSAPRCVGCKRVIRKEIDFGVESLPVLCHCFTASAARCSAISDAYFSLSAWAISIAGFNRERIRALNLHTTGMEFASEMIISAALRDCHISEVPTTLKKDMKFRWYCDYL